MSADRIVNTQSYPPTVEIPLSCGGGVVALIDADDLPLVEMCRWHLVTKGKTRYAGGRWKSGEKHAMHRLLLAAPPGLQVDHINGNGLDNRRCNIRLATASQNQINRWYAHTSGGFRGVYRRDGKLFARITVDNRPHYLGSFTDALHAARAYDAAAIRLHGEFARLNFPAEWGRSR